MYLFYTFNGHLLVSFVFHLHGVHLLFQQINISMNQPIDQLMLCFNGDNK